MNIQYLTYQEIDFTKWDFCIAQSANKLIYVEANYLNKIATNWDAIVLNDYDAVMPLIWRKKMGIRYLYQPAFLQQAGIYSKYNLTEEITEAFISLASTHFKFAEISINYANKLSDEKYSPIEKSYSYLFIKSIDRIKFITIFYLSLLVRHRL